MATRFEAHHLAWLDFHPDRDQEWLRARLSDGFHIHHVDGDHSNNDPTNLVLIEGADHFRLHGTDLKEFLQRRERKRPDKPRPPTWEVAIVPRQHDKPAKAPRTVGL